MEVGLSQNEKWSRKQDLDRNHDERRLRPIYKIKKRITTVVSIEPGTFISKADALDYRVTTAQVVKALPFVELALTVLSVHSVANIYLKLASATDVVPFFPVHPCRLTPWVNQKAVKPRTRSSVSKDNE
ncbi:hypothetical protein EVAR_97757_1 [Eumeta japonica]|uniref:Uncharacterized protein n=1 Tax=Eumeta variegata TaxID=151549 RepID=A0A4C1XAE5_EUMVA|nr:hypothetical protein EVAR_97757_1 [Eumeta japonica]